MSIGPEDLKPNAGTWAFEVESKLLDAALPADTEEIFVGGYPGTKPGSATCACHVCKAETPLSDKDIAVLLEHPKMAVLCPTCFFKLQEE